MLRAVVRKASTCGEYWKNKCLVFSQADRKIRGVMFFLQLLEQGCVMRLLPSFHLGLKSLSDAVKLSHNEIILFNLGMCMGIS